MSMYLNTLNQLGFKDVISQPNGKGRISSLSSISRQLFKSHYDGYHPRTSRQLATALKRYVNTRPKYERRSPEFVSEIRRKIICLHEYNQQIAKVKFRYPRSEQFDAVLMQYIELECGLLYDTYKEVDKKHENDVTERVLRLLRTTMYDALQSSDVSQKSTIVACDKILLKLYASVRDDFVSENKLVANTIVKLLEKLNLLDEVNKLKGENVPFQQDTFLKDSRVSAIRQSLATSDYESDLEDHDDDLVTMIDTFGSTPMPLKLFPSVDQKFKISNPSRSFDDFRTSYSVRETQKTFSNVSDQSKQLSIQNDIHMEDGEHPRNSVKTRINNQNHDHDSARIVSSDSNSLKKDNSSIIPDSLTALTKLEPQLGKINQVPSRDFFRNDNGKSGEHFFRLTETSTHKELIKESTSKNCGSKTFLNDLTSTHLNKNEVNQISLNTSHSNSKTSQRSTGNTGNNCEEFTKTTVTAVVTPIFNDKNCNEKNVSSDDVEIIEDGHKAGLFETNMNRKRIKSELDQVHPSVSNNVKRTSIIDFDLPDDTLNKRKTEKPNNTNGGIITIELLDDDEDLGVNSNIDEESLQPANNPFLNLLQSTEIKQEENEENRSPNFPVSNSDNNEPNILNSDKNSRNSSSTDFNKMEKSSKDSVNETDSAIVISDSEEEFLNSSSDFNDLQENDDDVLSKGHQYCNEHFSKNDEKGTTVSGSFETMKNQDPNASKEVMGQEIEETRPDESDVIESSFDVEKTPEKEQEVNPTVSVETSDVFQSLTDRELLISSKESSTGGKLHEAEKGGATETVDPVGLQLDSYHKSNFHSFSDTDQLEVVAENDDLMKSSDDNAHEESLVNCEPSCKEIELAISEEIGADNDVPQTIHEEVGFVDNIYLSEDTNIKMLTEKPGTVTVHEENTAACELQETSECPHFEIAETMELQTVDFVATTEDATEIPAATSEMLSIEEQEVEISATSVQKQMIAEAGHKDMEVLKTSRRDSETSLLLTNCVMENTETSYSKTDALDLQLQRKETLEIWESSRDGENTTSTQEQLKPLRQLSSEDVAVTTVEPANNNKLLNMNGDENCGTTVDLLNVNKAEEHFVSIDNDQTTTTSIDYPQEDQNDHIQKVFFNNRQTLVAKDVCHEFDTQAAINETTKDPHVSTSAMCVEDSVTVAEPLKISTLQEVESVEKVACDAIDYTVPSNYSTPKNINYHSEEPTEDSQFYKLSTPILPTNNILTTHISEETILHSKQETTTIQEPLSLYTLSSTVTEVPYDDYNGEKKVGDLELLANIAADQETLAVKTDSEKEIIDTASEAESYTKLTVSPTTPRRRKSKVKFDSKKKSFPREVLPRAVKQFQRRHPLKQKINVEEEENKRVTRNMSIKSKTDPGILKEKQKHVRTTKSEDSNYQPHDFIAVENSILPPPTNNVYAQKRFMETNNISEDSNDSCESTLFIDLGEKLTEKIKSVFEEETICDMLEFVTTEEKAEVYISIPENEDCSTDSFHILRQMEDFVDNNNKKSVTKITPLKKPTIVSNLEDQESTVENAENLENRTETPTFEDLASKLGADDTKTVKTTDHSIENILNKTPLNGENKMTSTGHGNTEVQDSGKVNVDEIDTVQQKLSPEEHLQEVQQKLSPEEHLQEVQQKLSPEKHLQEVQQKLSPEEHLQESTNIEVAQDLSQGPCILTTEKLPNFVDSNKIEPPMSEDNKNKTDITAPNPEICDTTISIAKPKIDDIREEEVCHTTFKTKAAKKLYEDRLHPSPYVMLRNFNTDDTSQQLGIRTRLRSKSSEQVKKRSAALDRGRSSSVDYKIPKDLNSKSKQTVDLSEFTKIKVAINLESIVSEHVTTEVTNWSDTLDKIKEADSVLYKMQIPSVIDIPLPDTPKANMGESTQPEVEIKEPEKSSYQNMDSMNDLQFAVSKDKKEPEVGSLTGVEEQCTDLNNDNISKSIPATVEVTVPDCEDPKLVPKITMQNEKPMEVSKDKECLQEGKPLKLQNEEPIDFTTNQEDVQEETCPLQNEEPMEVPKDQEEKDHAVIALDVPKGVQLKKNSENSPEKNYKSSKAKGRFLENTIKKMKEKIEESEKAKKEEQVGELEKVRTVEVLEKTQKTKNRDKNEGKIKEKIEESETAKKEEQIVESEIVKKEQEEQTGKVGKTRTEEKVKKPKKKELSGEKGKEKVEELKKAKNEEQSEGPKNAKTEDIIKKLEKVKKKEKNQELEKFKKEEKTEESKIVRTEENIELSEKPENQETIEESEKAKKETQIEEAEKVRTEEYIEKPEKPKKKETIDMAEKLKKNEKIEESEKLKKEEKIEELGKSKKEKNVEKSKKEDSTAAQNSKVSENSIRCLHKLSDKIIGQAKEVLSITENSETKKTQHKIRDSNEDNENFVELHKDGTSTSMICSSTTSNSLEEPKQRSKEQNDVNLPNNSNSEESKQTSILLNNDDIKVPTSSGPEEVKQKTAEGNKDSIKKVRSRSPSKSRSSDKKLSSSTEKDKSGHKSSRSRSSSKSRSSDKKNKHHSDSENDRKRRSASKSFDDKDKEKLVRSHEETREHKKRSSRSPSKSNDAKIKRSSSEKSSKSKTSEVKEKSIHDDDKKDHHKKSSKSSPTTKPHEIKERQSSEKKKVDDKDKTRSKSENLKNKLQLASMKNENKTTEVSHTSKDISLKGEHKSKSKSKKHEKTQEDTTKVDQQVEKIEEKEKDNDIQKIKSSSSSKARDVQKVEKEKHRDGHRTKSKEKKEGKLTTNNEKEIIQRKDSHSKSGDKSRRSHSKEKTRLDSTSRSDKRERSSKEKHKENRKISEDSKENSKNKEKAKEDVKNVVEESPLKSSETEKNSSEEQSKLDELVAKKTDLNETIESQTVSPDTVKVPADLEIRSPLSSQKEITNPDKVNIPEKRKHDLVQSADESNEDKDVPPSKIAKINDENVTKRNDTLDEQTETLKSPKCIVDLPAPENNSNEKPALANEVDTKSVKPTIEEMSPLEKKRFNQTRDVSFDRFTSGIEKTVVEVRSCDENQSHGGRDKTTSNVLEAAEICKESDNHTEEDMEICDDEMNQPNLPEEDINNKTEITTPIKLLLQNAIDDSIPSTQSVYNSTVFSSSQNIDVQVLATLVDSKVKHLPGQEADLSLLPIMSTSISTDSTASTVTTSVALDNVSSCRVQEKSCLFTYQDAEAVNRENLNSSEIYHTPLGLDDISPTKLPLASNQSLDYISPSTSMAEISNSMNLVQSLGTSSINFEVPDTSEIDMQQNNKQNSFCPNFVTRVTGISCFVEKESTADHNYTLGDPLLGGNNEDKNILTPGLSLSVSPDEFQLNESHLEPLSFNDTNFIGENGTLEEFGLLPMECKKEIEIENIPKPEDLQNFSVDNTIDPTSITDSCNYAVNKVLFLRGGEQNNAFSTIPDIDNIIETSFAPLDQDKQTLENSHTSTDESTVLPPVCSSYSSFMSSENQKVVVEPVEQYLITSVDQLKKNYIQDVTKIEEKNEPNVNKTSSETNKVQQTLKTSSFVELVKKDANKNDNAKVKDEMEKYTMRRHHRTPVNPPKKKNATQQQHTKSPPENKKSEILLFDIRPNNSTPELCKEGRIRVKTDLIKNTSSKGILNDAFSALEYINEHDQNVASEVVLPFDKPPLVENKTDNQKKKSESLPKTEPVTVKHARFDKKGNDFIMENILNVCSDVVHKKSPVAEVKIPDKLSVKKEVTDPNKKRKVNDNEIRRDEKRPKKSDDEESQKTDPKSHTKKQDSSTNKQSCEDMFDKLLKTPNNRLFEKNVPEPNTKKEILPNTSSEVVKSQGLFPVPEVQKEDKKPPPQANSAHQHDSRHKDGRHKNAGYYTNSNNTQLNRRNSEKRHISVPIADAPSKRLIKNCGNSYNSKSEPSTTRDCKSRDRRMSSDQLNSLFPNAGRPEVRPEDDKFSWIEKISSLFDPPPDLFMPPGNALEDTSSRK